MESSKTKSAGLYTNWLQGVGGNSLVPLEALDWDISILESVMELKISQTYANNSDSAIETEYVFPVDDDMAICALEVKVGDKTIVGKIMGKEKAKEKYQDAVASGNTGYLMSYDENQRDLIRMVVGNLPAKSKAVVRISVAKRLDVESNFWCIRIPAAFTPRYHSLDHSSPGESAAISQPFLAASDIPYKWDARVTIRADTGIRGIQSSSHKIVIAGKEGERSISVALAEKQVPDRDFVLKYQTEGINRPAVCIQQAKEFAPEYAALLTFCPPEVAAKSTGVGEYLFVLDCSGSMSGGRIEMAKKALETFLKGLPPNSYFNVIQFGTTFSMFFPESVMLNPDEIKCAMKKLKDVKADMGGTEIHDLLKCIFARSVRPGYPRSIFLITDGAVDNSSKVIALVRSERKNTRVHAFGIGSGASRDLIKGMARAGNGHYEFCAEKEDAGPKINEILAKASRPALSDLNIFWPKDWSVRRTSLASTVYCGDEAFFVYAICDKVSPGTVRVEGINTDSGKPVQMAAEIGKLEGCVSDGAWIYRIAAKALIDDYNLKEEEEVALATRYSVLSPHTSFVAICRQVEPLTGTIKEVKVPVPLPASEPSVASVISRSIGSCCYTDARYDEACRAISVKCAQNVLMFESEPHTELTDLLQCQCVNGSWYLENDVLHWFTIFSAKADVEKSIPEKLKAHPEGKQVWATVLAIHVLREKFSGKAPKEIETALVWLEKTAHVDIAEYSDYAKIVIGTKHVEDKCTYDLFGTSFVAQDFVYCEGCWGPGSCFGCCKFCSEHCHKGHTVSANNVSTAYCDCGVYHHNAKKCTRTSTGAEKAKQAMYFCYGCYGKTKLVCYQCSLNCHAGHNVVLAEVREAVCGCGDKCKCKP